MCWKEKKRNSDWICLSPSGTKLFSMNKGLKWDLYAMWEKKASKTHWPVGVNKKSLLIYHQPKRLMSIFCGQLLKNLGRHANFLHLSFSQFKLFFNHPFWEDILEKAILITIEEFKLLQKIFAKEVLFDFSWRIQLSPEDSFEKKQPATSEGEEPSSTS